MPYSIMLCMQDGDYAEDTVLETFLQLLAADRSKVIRYGSLAFCCWTEMVQAQQLYDCKSLSLYMRHESYTTLCLDAGKWGKLSRSVSQPCCILRLTDNKQFVTSSKQTCSWRSWHTHDSTLTKSKCSTHAANCLHNLCQAFGRLSWPGMLSSVLSTCYVLHLNMLSLCSLPGWHMS